MFSRASHRHRPVQRCICSFCRRCGDTRSNRQGRFPIFFGAYQHPRTSTVFITIRQTVFALTVSSVIAIVFYLLLVQLGIGKNFPRSAFIIDWGISLFFILALRLIVRFAGVGNQKLKVNEPELTPYAELQANWKKWLTEGLTYYGILGGTLAIYMLYNKITSAYPVLSADSSNAGGAL